MPRFDPFLSPYARTLIYGPPGGGKTRTLGTAAIDDRTSPVLYLEIGGNAVSIDFARPVVIQIVDMEREINLIYNYLLRGQPKTSPAVREFGFDPSTPFKTVVIDGLTQLYQEFLYESSVGSVDDTHGPASSFKIKGRDYGGPTQVIANAATMFARLPMHVFATALTNKISRGEGVTPYTQPLFYGKALDAATAPFTQVLYTQPVANAMAVARPLAAAQKIDIEKAERIVYFQGSSDWYAKDQLNLGVKALVDPSIGQILNLMEKRRAARLAALEGEE